MPHEYRLVNNPFSQFLYYTDASGNPLTGEAANFTAELVKDGNVVTAAGITFSEIDSTNAPGWIRVAIDSTSFVSAEGDYGLVAKHATDISAKFLSYTTVGAGNTYQSVGASFTATAGDGRITDGTNPIEGAAVYIRLADGTLLTQVTTDASGLWGPVYGILQNATIYAQKSGYAQNTGSITVSGSTATGPETDIALSTSSNAELLGSALVAFLRRVVGDKIGTKTDAMLLECVNSAASRVARDSCSPFYLRTAELALSSYYNTGTLTATNGDKTISLSGGTYPSWVDEHCLLYVGGYTYRVSSRTSDTEIELDSEYQEDTGSVTDWKIMQPSYALPDDLLQLKRTVYHSGARQFDLQEPTSFEAVQQAFYTDSLVDRGAWFWCVANQRLWLYPPPSEDALAVLIYYRRPVRIVSTSETVDVDPVQIDLLHAAMCCEAARRFSALANGADVEDCERSYRRCLQSNTHNDRTQHTFDMPQSRAFPRLGITPAMSRMVPRT